MLYTNLRIFGTVEVLYMSHIFFQAEKERPGYKAEQIHKQPPLQVCSETLKMSFECPFI